MSTSVIRAAFDSALKTWALGKGYPVAWPNQEFQNIAFYLRPVIIPATTNNFFLDGRHRQYTGIYQIGIVAEVGKGFKSIETVVNELDLLFKPSQTLENGGLRIYVTQPVSCSQIVQEPDKITCFAWLNYRADKTI